MENRNYVNSEYYAKLLREKMKRDNKVAKMQNRILHDKTAASTSTSLQSSQNNVQQKSSLIPKKVKKLSTPEKLPKHAARKSECHNSNLVKQKQLSSSDNDLLSEIDKSLSGIAQGFVYKKGN
jgi:hypothetical protein